MDEWVDESMEGDVGEWVNEFVHGWVGSMKDDMQVQILGPRYRPNLMQAYFGLEFG